MSDEAEAAETGPDYPGLLLRAGFNFHVFLAGALAFAACHGSAPEEYVDTLSAPLAPTWRGLRGHGADAVLQLVLENLASAGYAVEAVEAGAEESWALIRAIPLGLEAEEWRRILAPFGVNPQEMGVLFRVFMPLAAAAGARLDIEPRGDSLRLTVRRRPPGPPAPADLA